jgi:hypothetical protein
MVLPKPKKRIDGKDNSAAHRDDEGQIVTLEYATTTMMSYFEPFTPVEELVFLTRWKEMTESIDSGKTDEMWLFIGIAEVLPGRGTSDCVHYYNTHKVSKKAYKS